MNKGFAQARVTQPPERSESWSSGFGGLPGHTYVRGNLFTRHSLHRWRSGASSEAPGHASSRKIFHDGTLSRIPSAGFFCSSLPPLASRRWKGVACPSTASSLWSSASNVATRVRRASKRSAWGVSTSSRSSFRHSVSPAAWCCWRGGSPASCRFRRTFSSSAHRIFSFRLSSSQ